MTTSTRPAPSDAVPGPRRHPVYDPATGAVTREIELAGPADVDRVVAAAAAVGREWAESSLARRAAVLFAFREAVHAGREELAALVTAEHGKVLADARGEVARGLEVIDFACGLPHLLKGEFAGQVSTGVDSYSMRLPVGVAAVIGPFNFPAMVPCWFFPLAIAAGNAVVLKPSEKVPGAAEWFARRWHDAGLPDGVFTVLQGDRVAVDGLLRHPDIASVSFVGSTPVARYVYETAAAHGKRVQALGGAKNHMIVLPDADLDLAADAAVNAGFGSAGERCMAVSALVAVGPAGDALTARIAERMAGLRTGDGRRGCDMGPLVTREHRDRVAGYVQAGVDAGATLVVDGREVRPDGDPGGFWLGPTLFDQVTIDMTIYTDEIFGPVLSVLRVPDEEAALALVNANPYGNGAALFTRDGGAARRFERTVTAGMVGINVPIPVPMAYFSFGGWKDSFFGQARAHGTAGLDFFTRQKVVTRRWTDTRGIDLGFPSSTG